MNIDINNPKDVFYSFLNGSKVSYVAAGSGGLGLELLNMENTTYKTLTTDNKNVVCSKIFLKLVPLMKEESYDDFEFNEVEYEETLKTKFEFLVPGHSFSVVHTSLDTEFWSEVEKQTIIYKESVNNLEPICPPILYTKCYDHSESNHLINLLYEQRDDKTRTNIDDDEDPLLVIEDIFDTKPKLRLGVIAMGFTTDYITLHKAIRNDPSKKDLYIKLSIYELLRLYTLGYLHGDFSLSNIMINPTYNYTGTNTGRAMLIDFGMTFQHNYTDTNIVSILNKMLNTRVPNNGVLPIEHNNYKWLKRYIEQHGENIENKIGELAGQINTHNSNMINMIQNTYPDILVQIRSYVNTQTNTNIFTGGFMLDKQHTTNGRTIQNKSKTDIKPSYSISVDKFNSIFNPNNLDILKLKDDYLHTLMLGYTSIKHGKKHKGKFVGGKKRRKHKPISSRNRKTKSKKRNRKPKSKKRNRKTKKCN